ncbi:extracellular solute-binding protein [Streptosporangium sp. 'caverna']|uniref:extracellular solute-binding protein n=1 Tax=Streptosporangium sp. 'caverna' TaxID=2202249 RepID=UPI001EF7C6E6|nr:extracellular solute-binding protein [Streptosporangium sp. 'caverna']
MISLGRRSVALLAAASLLLGGCASEGGGGDTGKAASKTIEWWHIQNIEPMLPVWQAMATEYQKAHPGITIKVTPLENEAYKAKLTTLTQSGSIPDIFNTWGGGVLQQQIEAGLAKDITADIAPWADTLTPASVQPYQFDGKTYAVPFDVGMVGFWYNKALFAKAGVSEPPTTWTGFLDTVKKLKAAGITPIALGGKDKWPGHYYWAYLAMRVAGLPALKQAGADATFTAPEFVQAGERLKELVDLDPFQKGFLGAGYGTPDGQAALMGSGKAAMELMGQWAPTVQRDSSGTPDGIGDDLAFFPFPAVEGGKGDATDAFGGGGGFAVGKDAPPEAIDFLKFISNLDNQRRAVATGAFLPVVKGAEDAIKDAKLASVSATLGKAAGFQLYLDQAYAPAVGQQVNDSVAELIAGTLGAKEVTEAITETAKNE